MRQENRTAINHITRMIHAMDEEVPLGVIFVVRDALQDYLATENRSLKRMEKYREDPGTASNYRAGKRTALQLEAAIQDIENDDLDSLIKHLDKIGAKQ